MVQPVVGMGDAVEHAFHLFTLMAFVLVGLYLFLFVHAPVLISGSSDLNWIAALPGRKIILRGNHDYWWASLKKMQTATENNFRITVNNFFTCGTTAICGSRGWLLPSSDNFNADDAAIYRREGLRLEASLEAAYKNKYLYLNKTYN